MTKIMCKLFVLGKDAVFYKQLNRRVANNGPRSGSWRSGWSSVCLFENDSCFCLSCKIFKSFTAQKAKGDEQGNLSLDGIKELFFPMNTEDLFTLLTLSFPPQSSCYLKKKTSGLEFMGIMY